MGMLQGARTNILRRLIPCFGKTTPTRRIRSVARVRATTPPETSRTVIRDAFGKRHHLTVGDRVHVDRAYDVPVAYKSTGLASPVPPSGLVTMAAYGTPAGRTTLIPGEAHDAVLFRLLLQVIDVPAIFPLAHALVVVAATVFSPNTIRVADEHRFHSMFLTKIHDLTGPFMAQVAHPAFIPQRQLCAGFPQLSPTA